MIHSKTLYFLFLLLLPCAIIQATELQADQSDQVFQPEKNTTSPVKINKIDTENMEVGLFSGLLNIEDFGNQSTYGARVAYRVNEYFFVEGRYGQTQAGLTSFERLNGNVRLLTNPQRNFQYYDLSLGMDILPGESFIAHRVINSAFYIASGLGSTDFAGSSRFTYNLGTGFRLILTDWLAVNLEARDQVMDRDVTGPAHTTHNLSLTGGLFIFF